MEWTEDEEKNLALQYLLIQKLGTVEDYASNFCHYYYYTGGKIINYFPSRVRNLIIPFVRDYKIYIQSQGSTEVKLKMPISNNKFFIVQGHDTLQTVDHYLEKRRFEAIILYE